MSEAGKSPPHNLYTPHVHGGQANNNLVLSWINMRPNSVLDDKLYFFLSDMYLPPPSALFFCRGDPECPFFIMKTMKDLAGGVYLR